MKSGPSLRINNFDLIRLIAALQVAVVHGITDLRFMVDTPLHHALRYFPGVPVFFVVSGFLISMSWERAPSWQQYAWNRVLRIYPALWVCLAVSIALFLACGIRPDSPGQFTAWIVAQTTMFQYYNPDFLRGFGLGVLNGSLWTIPVELQFYLLLPLLAIVAGRRRAAWFICAAAAAVLMLYLRRMITDPQTLAQKLIYFSILPYLFYFVIGIVVRQWFENTPQLFVGKALYWAAAYALWIGAEIVFQIPGAIDNQLNILSIVLVAMLTVSVAFSLPDLSSKFLKGNDISYGVYIYHGPLFNLLLFLSFTGSIGFAAGLAGTITCSVISWRFIEKPALALKHYSLRSAALVDAV